VPEPARAPATRLAPRRDFPREQLFLPRCRVGSPPRGWSAPLRYCSAMATIQIREIPESTYEVIRKRARASGRSIQSYLRDVVVDLASRPTTEEVLAMMEAARTGSQTTGATHESILADLAADRR
jgi:plasmid stability protein